MFIKEIGIIGSGTMGGGIAQLAAQKGYSVVLEDINEEYVTAGLKQIRERLEKRVTDGKINIEEKDNILSRIRKSTKLEELGNSDLIIEAVTENDEIKRQVFTKLDKICPKDVIFTWQGKRINIHGQDHRFKRGAGYWIGQ
ncbi:MAG: 3-hydroxyacyl-CoA dehydrogenase NAD-binding domain-containing protein [Candidatus Methanoperedens sp.]|nr:3-hydroxyacyl-CoA dehydrogenase NAD-binding domain-containing protein [Candidatus Methanoperedens sp.]